ncbi:IS3 family transposase [Streptomyces sp. NPDC050256]|uniref:IS3 family transposase n=1 Tax=Streptomyces sp. NPDC050256 TaxID=3365607 RepID=UPI0037A1A75A
MSRAIDEHRARIGGVEPICRMLTEHDCKIAPSIYYAHYKRLAEPSARTVRDARLKGKFEEICASNYRVYGVRKIWRGLNRQDIPVARCAVERLSGLIHGRSDLGIGSLARSTRRWGS